MQTFGTHGNTMFHAFVRRFPVRVFCTGFHSTIDLSLSVFFCDRFIMNTTVSILCDPDLVDNTDFIRGAIISQLHLKDAPSFSHRLIRRSIDARSKIPKFVLDFLVAVDEPLPMNPESWSLIRPDQLAGTVIIVGAGPAGYFAAIRLLENGIKPVVLERGKDVLERRKDIQPLLKRGSIHPDSNYCFGEGGAGAYSDGKLYTRSHKRGDIQQILAILVAHGASPDILIDTHPHIGSNRLPRMVKNMRGTILSHGGEIHFNSKVTDFIIDNQTIAGVTVNDSHTVTGNAVILATGHSARDIYETLAKRQILVEPKPFALGVRVEHPQALIDQIQYHRSPRHSRLPASSYRLATQIEGRGVFSFCMCPGGFIVPASTADGELVLNGMSLSGRNAEYANSGIVVEIRLDDIQKDHRSNPLAIMEFQKSVEQAAFRAGGGLQVAPAQRMTDFVSGKMSPALPPTSYLPGVTSALLDNVLPDMITRRLKAAFQVFGQKMRGYFTEEAKILAVESRTSSPVRIPRDSNTLMHTEIKNLFPCGEGAGYAGGIVSAALDGQRSAGAAGKVVRRPG